MKIHIENHILKSLILYMFVACILICAITIEINTPSIISIIWSQTQGVCILNGVIQTSQEKH